MPIDASWKRRRAQSRAIVNLAAFTGVSASSVVRAVRGLRHPKPSEPAQASGRTGAKIPVVRMKEHDA
jgi:hypothetical protein